MGGGGLLGAAPYRGLTLMRRNVAIAAAVTAALLTAYVGWQGLSEDEGSESTHQRRPTFGALERKAFSVLRGPTRPVPLTLQARLRRARNPAVRGLWFDQARYVPVDSGMWVVNGRGVTCIVRTRGGAVSCENRAALLRSGVSLGVVDLGPPPERKAREFLVLGLVPDWVRAVRVQVGKRTRLVAVEKNSYSLRAPTPILVKRFEA